MSYGLKGIIKVIGEPQTFSSGFTKREFVVTVDEGKYPQDISLELLQDKVSLLDGVSDGDAVEVKFDIRGREFNGRYFNNLVCWKLESSHAECIAPAGDARPPIPADSEAPGEFDEDIPF